MVNGQSFPYCICLFLTWRFGAARQVPITKSKSGQKVTRKRPPVTSFKQICILQTLPPHTGIYYRLCIRYRAQCSFKTQWSFFCLHLVDLLFSPAANESLPVICKYCDSSQLILDVLLVLLVSFCAVVSPLLVILISVQDPKPPVRSTDRGVLRFYTG